MSGNKMAMPGRGIFCQHFQCFDLANYLELISNSENPRWVCPICKQPAYEFKIDCIMSAILAMCPGDKAAEVSFRTNGEFSIISTKNKAIKSEISNIEDLPIADKIKRKPRNKEQESEKPQKKKARV